MGMQGHVSCMYGQISCKKKNEGSAAFSASQQRCGAAACCAVLCCASCAMLICIYFIVEMTHNSDCGVLYAGPQGIHCSHWFLYVGYRQHMVAAT